MYVKWQVMSNIEQLIKESKVAIASRPLKAPTAFQVSDALPKIVVSDVKKTYQLRDLLSVDSEQFLANCYQVIFQRELDDDALSYNKALKNGKLTKEQVIIRLRHSTEGKMKQARIRGLAFAYWRYKIKILRSAIKPWIKALLTLHRLRWQVLDLQKQVESLETELAELKKSNKTGTDHGKH
jgi:hypothetical protein